MCYAAYRLLAKLVSDHQGLIANDIACCTVTSLHTDAYTGAGVAGSTTIHYT
jgi:hypothetical protein